MLNNQDFTRERQLYIGGSDIGAILGLSPYRTAVDVWLEKIGTPKESANSLPLRFGSFAEEFIAREYALETGYIVNAHENAFIHPEFSFFRAHVDRLVFDALPLPQSFLAQQEKRVNEDDSIDDAMDDIFANRSLSDDLVLNMTNPSRAKRILECKTANPFAQYAWGDTRTDQIPLAYLCQCAWYMAITQIEVTDLAVLFGNSDFRIYTITRDLELEHLMLERAEYFWNEYVQKSSPPPTQSEGDCQALFQQHLPGKSIEANPQLSSLIMQLQELSAKASQTEKSMSQIRQSIMNEMGDAESIVRDGQILATWKLPKTSSRLDGKRLEKEHPDLYFSYQMPIQNSRRFILKNGAQNHD